ncbi:hypothetical protein [Nocardioides sp. Soil805]|uniref:hypothetical protein n=1 Tax=Nocardioides sp. Soil805 TaxID=1736416 RepID=UPI0012E3AFB4|nr:hypothetical protein [Nocardioides sp. Soil805]
MTVTETARRGMNPVVKVVLLLWVGCAVVSLLTFVFALNSDAQIERALEARYDADISFERHDRKRVLLIDGEDRSCKVAGHLFSLDDVSIRCFVPDEPPALR